MMKWSSVIAGREEGRRSAIQRSLEVCAERMREDLGDKAPDLVVAFISPHYSRSYERIPGLVKELFAPSLFIGCTAGGLIGGGEEIEQDRGVAVAGAILPGVKVTGFHITNDNLPDPDAPPSAWEEAIGVENASEPSFILLPDPFTLKIDSLVQGLDYAFPSSVKVGGLASGASKPGVNALFLNDEVFREGMVGAAVSGNVVVDTIVAQGCRPIGKPFRVTNCHGNILLELDGKTAIRVLKDVLENLTPQDQELARHSLFLGVVMNEFKDSFKAGDFLIRNLIGIVPEAGALVVGELLRNERTVQFHLRDAATSSDDLRLLLKGYVDNSKGKSGTLSGALLFSCLGRGKYLYGHANHDSNSFREYLGEVPLAGFFCNGEIGPVGGTTFLHGYTSSFGLFRPKTS
ncbi:MAG TPA: FIST N-terminal domain-containing protein [Candidatus Obscuribacterales bacterium]